MATISPVTLSVAVNLGNADVKVKYDLNGSSFDIASGQPYTETCKLIGDDTGIVPAEDGSDDAISTGLLQLGTVVFASAAPISRTLTKTLAKAVLNEDIGTDEIRAVVTLTPQVPSITTKESNQVVGAF